MAREDGRSRQVRKLPRDPGPAGWNEILPRPLPPTELTEGITADWLVVGAGFAGLSAARRLRQLRPQDRIVVLEAVRVGEGPAGRNSGFMIDLPHHVGSEGYGGALEEDRRQTRLHRAAIDFAQQAAHELGFEGSTFQLRGKHNAAATEAGERHLEVYARHLDRLGERYEWLDADGMRTLTGLDFYRAGLYTPGTAIIQPAAYVRAIAASLVDRGVELYERSSVTGLDLGPMHTAHTPRGKVSAPKVILGVNGHAESFGLYRRRLMHVFTYASMTRELGADEVRRLGGEPEWHLAGANPVGTSVRRIRENRIVVRNRFTYDPSMEVGQRRLVRIARDHDAAFRARFPMLSEVDMEYRWGGRLCLSRNGVPGFGEVAEGLFSAVCQNGLGVAKGTVAGIAAAELATGTGSWRADQMLAYDPPRKIPPEPFMYAGANAYLRWAELRARGE